MKKNFLTMAVIMLIASTAGKAQTSTLEKVLLFGAGYLSGQIVHGAGHFAASKLSGAKMQFKFDAGQFPPIYELTTFDRRKQNAIIATASGGFVSEIVSSEIILSTTGDLDGDRDYDVYLLGWLTMTTIDPIVYIVRDKLTRGGYGDIQSIRQAGGDSRTLSGFLIAHSLATLVRVALKLSDQKTIKIASTPTALQLQVTF